MNDYVRAAVFRPGILRIPRLSAFLPEINEIQSFRRFEHYDSALGWGIKHTAGKARRYAQRRGLPYIALEDGFIRSIGLGVCGRLPFSLVVDKQGIYYDARSPSDLEQMINQQQGLSSVELQRAQRCISTIVAQRFSKYNLPSLPQPQASEEAVLVIDQTVGDASIVGSLSTPQHFHHMLEAAMDRHPNQPIIVKVHPDVVAGKKQGYLYPLPFKDHRLSLDSRGGDPWRVLCAANHVYTVSSLMGFEALMAGIPVTCFGVPFYAGWGLTLDQQQCVRRGGSKSLEEVFHCAYLCYARYVHPMTGLCCMLEDILSYLKVLLR